MFGIQPQKILIGLFLVFFFIPCFASLAQAKEPETQYLRVTVQANWSGCDGDCDGKQSGNHVNSGGYTINIIGTVKTKKGSEDFINYEPESLTGTCFVHQTTTSTSENCQKCNPVETIKGSRTVTFGKDKNSIATLQAFMGQVGAGFALQLTGDLSTDYANLYTSLKERKIISFSATGPVTMITTTRDCKSCAPETETLEGGFGMTINADMTTKKSGSASWKSKVHPMDTLGASVIDLDGPQTLGPERDQQGRAQFNVTWSLGEAEPTKLKIKKIFFNYDGNQGQAVQLKSEKDDSEINAPEWTASEPPKPAAFPLGTAFKVKTLFGVEGKRIEKAEIWAEEEVLNQSESPVKKGFQGVKKQMVNFSPGETEKEVEFTIKSAQPVVSVNQVKWSWRANVWYQGSTEPEEVEIKTEGPGEKDSTEHTIYIVGGKPIKGTTAYVYLVKKGCQWAEGKKDKKASFEDIWMKFWNIPCPEDTACRLGSGASGVLSYEHGKTVPLTTIGLLQKGIGKCAAWQELFWDMMGSQGIEVKKYTVYPKSDEYKIVSMIVGRGMAQGNVDPKRAFVDHAIVEYCGMFYDPSYWTFHPVGPGEDISTYEEKTFAAYCTAEAPERCIERCTPTHQSEDSWDLITECVIRECNCLGNHPFRCEVRAVPE